MAAACVLTEDLSISAVSLQTSSERRYEGSQVGALGQPESLERGWGSVYTRPGHLTPEQREQV